MAASQEILAAAPGVAGVSMYYIAGMAAVIGAGLHVKKLTPQLHHTINEGERGVWLYRGKPMLLDGFTEADVARHEKEYPFCDLVHYRIAEPSWNYVGLFKTLQTVDVADQPSVVAFELESSDNPTRQLVLQANMTWNVNPDGDNPVRALTRVKHIKRDKKDAEAKDPERLEHAKSHPLEARVLQIGTASLGRVLSGRMAAELFTVTYLDPEFDKSMPIAGEDINRFENMRKEIQERTIKNCARNLIYYGAQLSGLDLLPITRTKAQVHAEAIRTLSVFDAAVVGAESGSDEAEQEGSANVEYLHGVGTPEQRAASS